MRLAGRKESIDSPQLAAVNFIGKVGEGSCFGLSKSMHILEHGVIEQISELSRSRSMDKVILQDVRSRRDKEHRPKVKVDFPR